jgi:hypothetical protein
MPGQSFNITDVFHIVSNGSGAHLAEASWRTPQAPYLCLDRSSVLDCRAWWRGGRKSPT